MLCTLVVHSPYLGKSWVGSPVSFSPAHKFCNPRLPWSLSLLLGPLHLTVIPTPTKDLSWSLNLRDGIFLVPSLLRLGHPVGFASWGGSAAVIWAGELWDGPKDVPVTAASDHTSPPRHLPASVGGQTEGGSVAREVYSLAFSREGGLTS